MQKKNIHSYNLQLMLSTFLPFYLLPPVTKFRGVFGGRKLFLPSHSGLIFDGRVETAITSRTPHPSAARVANKSTGSRDIPLASYSTFRTVSRVIQVAKRSYYYQGLLRGLISEQFNQKFTEHFSLLHFEPLLLLQWPCVMCIRSRCD